MAGLTMRDAFWNEIYEIAKVDKNVVLVISDMGAPSLDKFKRDLPGQVIHVGIAEQNAILVAAGLALTGKKPYVYSISSFLTTRCFEQIKIYMAGMHLPITIVGVGAGVCYAESGPTHHALEDLTTLRGLPTMKIYNPSDNILTVKSAHLSYKYNGPSYIRLDRIKQDNIYESSTEDEGFEVAAKLSDINIVATGNMVHNALEIAAKLKQENIEVGIVDAYLLPLPSKMIEILKNSRHIVSIEEHSLAGGMSSNLCELIIDNDIQVHLKRYGMNLKDGYCYTYGGRSVIHEEYKMDNITIINYIKNLCAGGKNE